MKPSLQERLDQERAPGIDMAPLIDMVFILLIFFIVTTAFVKETGVEVREARGRVRAAHRERHDPHRDHAGRRRVVRP